MRLKFRCIEFVCVLTLSTFSQHLWAEQPIYKIEIINHLFEPSTLEVPAGVKFKLIVLNRDTTPEEFESYELNREKVVVGEGKITIFIGPLMPGEYSFFGEFNPKTAQGKMVAR